MKIGDIKVGTEYGVVESKSRYGRSAPRRVEVLAVEEVEERTWNKYSGAAGTRKVRKLRVKFLDEPTSSWTWYPIYAAAKDSERVVEARLLVATWAELSPGIKARIEAEQELADAKAAIKQRLSAVGFDMSDEGPYDVRVSGSVKHNLRVEFWSQAIEPLLLKLEGKGPLFDA